MLKTSFVYSRRELLCTAAAGSVLAAAGCKPITPSPGPECDPPSVSGVDWIPDVAHPVAWGEEHLTTADGAPRTMSIYYPSSRFIPPRQMLRSCITRWPVVLLLHGQPPYGISTNEPDAYNKRFYRIAIALARSGYVVVAPLHGAGLPTPAAAPAMIAAAQNDIAWIRTGWHEAKWVEPAGRPVTVIGHSYGAIQAARIAAGWPDVAALVSLSGPYSSLPDHEDVVSLFQSINCPSLFMFTEAADVLDERIEGNSNPSNDLWPLLQKDRYAAIYGGQHFDYLDPGATANAPRGECDHIGQLAADLTALFVARTVRSITSISVGLGNPRTETLPNGNPRVVLSDAQKALAIGYLPAIDRRFDECWEGPCRILLKWRADDLDGWRWIPRRLGSRLC